MSRPILMCWTLFAICLILTGCGESARRQSPSLTAAASNEQSVAARHSAPSSEPTKLLSNATAANEAIEIPDWVDAADIRDETLSARIMLDETAINFDTPFRIVLTNNADHPIRIWNPEIENGYYQLSFQFRNSRSGEKHIAHKRDIGNTEFWESDGLEPVAEFLEIPSGDSLTTQVVFSRFDWGHLAWTGLPGPNSPDSFSLAARFESTDTPDGLNKRVWTGRILSQPVTVNFVAPKLKTPHDYLWNGFSRRAIEIMDADPTWISAQDEYQCTPLHHAARFGHSDAVKWLVDHGADVDAIAYNGFTPLHLSDDRKVIELILQIKPDLTIRCRGQTPLQRAAYEFVHTRGGQEQENWRQIVDLYLRAGAEYDILTAIHRDDFERVKRILKKSPQLADDFQEQSPLRTAACLGRFEICRYLIDNFHVDVDDVDRGVGYPIIKGALGFPQVVRFLIEHGADLKTPITWRGGRTGIWIIGDDATALHFAADDGVPETISLLINAGVDIFATAHDSADETSKQTALEVAAFFGKADNASAMLSHPKFAAADQQLRQNLLDRCLQIGASPRWPARESQRPKLVKLLLENGANPNTSENGVTAMQGAASEIHPTSRKENSEIKEIISVLMEHGAQVDIFSAVAIGDEEQVRRLLNQNPQSANARRPDGYPVLHVAVSMNYRNIVAALLSAGGDVNIRNESESTGGVGQTPLGCAKFWERHEIAKQLIDAGAVLDVSTQ